MNTNSEQINEKRQICSYCALELAQGAILCPTCRNFQKPRVWRNHIKFSDIGLIAAFGVILVGLFQLKELQQDRIETSEALSRAINVEQVVKELETEIAQSLSRATRIEKTISELEAEIAEARKQIEDLAVYRTASKSGVEMISEILKYSRELQTQLDSIRSQVEEIDERVSTPRPPPTPGLAYASSNFHRVGNELIGRVTFKPTGNIALSQLKFNIRILEPNDIRILEVKPGAAVAVMVITSISQSGNTAELQYTEMGGSNPAIWLRLSGPAVLKIEGSPGLEPFTVRAE